MNTPTLVIQDVFKIYKEGDVETVALRGANLTVERGEFVAIQGRSGSGKSTLMNLIGGLAIVSAGRIIINETDLSRLNEGQRAAFRRQHVGIVFQSDNLIPFLTASENVVLPMTLEGHENAHRRAASLLTEIGLAERLHHRPNQLSGGERQRVAIAVALANEPDLLLADELTGELDSVTSDSIMALLKRLNVERGLTLIVVTHNPTVAARAGRQVRISDGQLSEEMAVAHA
ncbi:MAG: ATP-binding cassette domain-containing protein [Anaerolineaceae bacterium]|nr:ATP-binding cassette domain-containing protein [Anaerolineaceae bacterium]